MGIKMVVVFFVIFMVGFEKWLLIVSLYKLLINN